MARGLEGKVAFVTGAARGQGRAHAIRFAEEGADIIALDLCEQIPSVPYPLATAEDLDETVELVEKTGRRIVAEQCDVRDFRGLKAAVARGVAELGRIDFVLANAGVLPLADGENADDTKPYTDAVDVLLNGVYYTIEAALPALVEHGSGGAIVITSSTAGLNALCPGYDEMTSGFAGYHAAKHGVVGLMRYYAKSLAAKNIRVNTVHPTGVSTPMVVNDYAAQYFGDRPQMLTAFENLLPVQLVEASDVSEAMVYLCGQSGRYLTGCTLPVDAGLTAK
ncbi:mycofactocin-coupled SDR family oxidoreductase [Amycolatopsis silviterrae]|uniref:Mycofactocin-coupled SDR family oxidoreductase n=1 Tax=Amycolatopsis silviterrae TaxID=1656914 RepID=A0ABW5HJQ3_9PSEU